MTPAGGVGGGITVDGGSVSIQGSPTISWLHVLNGGTAATTSNAVLTLSSTVPGYTGVAVMVEGGDLNLQNTSKVNAGSNRVEIQGTTGKSARAGNLNTFAATGNISAGREEVTITASKLVIGSTGSGDTTVTLGNGALRPDLSDHRYSQLTVVGAVDWLKGDYAPTVSETDNGIRDWWHSSGTFKIEGSTTSLSPTGATTVTREGMVISGSTISPYDGKSTTLPSVTTINWGWKAGTAYGVANWTAQVVT